MILSISCLLSKSFNTLLRQLSEFFEKLRLHFFEIETGFALHVFLQLRADAFEEIGKHVDRHEIKGYIIFLDLRRAEKDFLFPLLTIVTIKRICGRCIGCNSKVLCVRLEDGFEFLEDDGEF